MSPVAGDIDFWDWENAVPTPSLPHPASKPAWKWLRRAQGSFSDMAGVGGLCPMCPMLFLLLCSRLLALPLTWLTSITQAVSPRILVVCPVGTHDSRLAPRDGWGSVRVGRHWGLCGGTTEGQGVACGSRVGVALSRHGSQSQCYCHSPASSRVCGEEGARATQQRGGVFVFMAGSEQGWPHLCIEGLWNGNLTPPSFLFLGSHWSSPSMPRLSLQEPPGAACDVGWALTEAVTVWEGLHQVSMLIWFLPSALNVKKK